MARTNFSNCSLVTSVLSIQKPVTVTSWSGFSSACPPGEPMIKVPPGIQTMLLVTSAGARLAEVGAESAIGADGKGAWGRGRSSHTNAKATAATKAPPAARRRRLAPDDDLAAI